jgi:hypothetical protein
LLRDDHLVKIAQFWRIKELSFGLEPMLQREAVSPALRFIELIRPLGNPDVPVNRRDRPGFAI